MRKLYFILLYVLCLCLSSCVRCSHRHNHGDENIKFNNSHAQPSIITINEGGEEYDIVALDGQVIVMFNKNVSNREAVKTLKRNGAKILVQIPQIHYYLVKIPNESVSVFFSRMYRMPDVDFTYPNIISNLCSLVPCVIDATNKSHGRKVVEMMLEDNKKYTKKVKKYNVALNDDEISKSASSVYPSVFDILDNLGKNESALINISIGEPLYRINRFFPNEKVLWNDKYVTEGNKKSYIRRSVNKLKELVKILSYYDDRDFVIVKAIGNEGMKEYELIINSLVKELSKEERKVFERHILSFRKR